MSILIILFAIFFALNMGGASFAASFAAAYGGKLIDQKRAAFLFILFVVLGSILLGENVSITLGTKLMPSELFDAKAIGYYLFFSRLKHVCFKHDENSAVDEPGNGGGDSWRGCLLRAIGKSNILLFDPLLDRIAPDQLFVNTLDHKFNLSAEKG